MNKAIDWFAEHGVAANMLMVVIVLGGLLTIPVIEQEVFPEVESDLITISVVYRGASPEDVEEGVCIKIEEAVVGIDGIDRMTSSASFGAGVVTLEVDTDADVREVLDDVQSAVDTIDTFPEETERPIVQEFEISRQVVKVAVSGDVDERTLRSVAEQVRDEILVLPGISRVLVGNVRPYEISIEVSEEDLQRWGLTFDEVATAVRQGSLDLSGGSVKTAGGEILLRTKAQAYRQRQFEDLVLRTLPNGSRLLLGDVATVVDGFEDTGQRARFDGRPAAMVSVYRVGEQRALDVAAQVAGYIAEAAERMPPGITLETWRDEARVLAGRLDLLVRNGRMGLILVFLTLALFLRFKLALWVTLGIPISFLGTLWLMPSLDVSVNMISLFGFIIVLGIVVDDAIVVGENIYSHHEKGKQGLDAVRAGAGQVSTPVVFAVLTTIAAFAPLMTIPGIIGKFIGQLPWVVVPTLIFSLVESLLILPAHLAHLKRRPRAHSFPIAAAWVAFQGRFSAGMQWVIQRVYRPTLEVVVTWRYLSLATGLLLLMTTFALLGAGHIRFLFFPPVEADNIVAFVTMPSGTPDDVTERAVAQIERAALDMRDELAAAGEGPVFRHVLASVGEQPFNRDQNQGFGRTGSYAGGHLGEVNIELTPSEEREVGATELLNQWRERTGEVPDASELVFSSAAISTGDPIDIELSGPSIEVLREASNALQAALAEYPGVSDIADSFQAGQQEVRVSTTPEAEALGLTRSDLARQVRQGFYGEEAQRIQRGRDEVRVMVRYPESERASLGDLERMRVRAPGGIEAPFSRVAEVEWSRGDAVIQRAERRRSINVTADVDLTRNDPNAILADVQERVMPGILARHPGTTFALEGQQREQAQTIAGLQRGFLLALAIIYALLAIPFRSYVQPVIVMLAIPFGVMAAIWGHLIVGMDLTIMSMFGVVALTGVLVNDSLVMIDFVNRARAEGASTGAAIREAGPARFRAIWLTSLTTFAGLLPLLLERSLQARFLIPMAVSLGFGVLFATFITLLLVPVAYVIVEDVRGQIMRALGRTRAPEFVTE